MGVMTSRLGCLDGRGNLPETTKTPEGTAGLWSRFPPMQAPAVPLS